jgi:photosystem II stability/assembly factor-like uncharacterized protein
MAVTAPPRPPNSRPAGSAESFDRDELQALIEALIEEARQRARRRRRRYGAVVLLAALASGVALASGIGGGGAAASSVAEGLSKPAAAQSGTGRWGPSHGPDGGDVFTLAVGPGDPQVIYAGGWGNVFKSTNGGGSWSAVNAQPRVTALAIDPTQQAVVYAASSRGITKTVDGGRRWRAVNAGLFDGETVYQRGHRLAEGFITTLIVDAHNPATVYAITDRGLFRTTNGGARWRIIGPRPYRMRSCATCFGQGYGYSVGVAIDPQRARSIYASWSRGGSDRNLYKSSDGGDSWRRIEVRAPFPSFASLALDGDARGTLFAASYTHPGVVKSIDGGSTWNPAGLPRQHVSGLQVDPGSRGTLYAQTNGKLFRSTDGGATWRTAGNGSDLVYGTVVSNPQVSTTLYAAGSRVGGIVKSLDGGRTWGASNTGLVATFVNALLLAPGSSKTLYAGTWQGVYSTTDGGLSWRRANGGLRKKPVIAFAVSPLTPQAIYAGTRGYGVFKSNDHGLSWRPVNHGLPVKVIEGLTVDPGSPDTVFALGSTALGYGTGSGGLIFKTVNGGAHWQAIASPKRVQVLAVDPRTAGTLFAGTTRDGLFRSTDAGTSWQLVATSPGAPTRVNKSHLTDPDAFVAIAIDPLDSKIVYAGTRTGGILTSSDGGDTWVVSNTGLSSKLITNLAVDPRDPRILYVTSAGGVFRSTDGARSWHRFGRGLGTYNVTAFAIDPAGQTVYAATTGGGVLNYRVGH